MTAILLAAYLIPLAIPVLLGLGLATRAAHYMRVGLRRRRCQEKR